MENLNDSDDRTRRDALARSLCARICDERHSIDALRALDEMLTRFDNPTIGGSLLKQLRNDRYAVNQGDAFEQAHRKGWNRGIEHAIALIQIERGMDELAEAESIDLSLKHALTGVE